MIGAVCIAALAVLLAISAAAGPALLYDDTSGLPDSQPALLYADDAGGTATPSAAAYGVHLVTDTGVKAGYANWSLSIAIGFPPIIIFPAMKKDPDFPILNRHAGFSLCFQHQLFSESHANNNRAGFSVIVISRDLMGIELAFWEDEIWAQSGADFLHAEGVLRDNTAATVGEVDYELAIKNDRYVLHADGTPLLGGPLRDYSTHGEPYSLPDFVFFGDDTSSAQADIGLGRVEIKFPLVITSTSVAGNTCILEFTGCPGVTDWKVKGSTDLTSFPLEKTTDSTITEPEPGIYHAEIDITSCPPDFFLRIER